MADKSSCLDDDTLEDIAWNNIDEVIKINTVVKNELEDIEDKLISKYKYFYKVIK